MSEYFPKPNSLGANIKVELDLSNYATKADVKNATGVDTSQFAWFKQFKIKVDQLDVDKLAPVLVYLSKLSNVVKNDFVKKRCI